MSVRHQWGSRAEANDAAAREEEAKQPRGPNLYHEMTYWFHAPMTLEQWIALDDAIEAAFQQVFGEDEETFDIIGLAGPIPGLGEAHSEWEDV